MRTEDRGLGHQRGRSRFADRRLLASMLTTAALFASLAVAPTAGASAARVHRNDVPRSARSSLPVSMSGTWLTATAGTMNGDGTSSPSTAGALSYIDCPSATLCDAAGQYLDSSNLPQVYVSQSTDPTNDSWVKSTIPGLAALNAGATLANGGAAPQGLVCPATGDCTVAGYYVASNGSSQPFVASQSNGAWASAQTLPSSGILSANGASSYIDTLSCFSPGNCVVGGSYSDSNNEFQAFVDSETNGAWGNAVEVPGTSALNAGATSSNYGASVYSVSCSSAVNCVAAGVYTDAHDIQQSFVASMSNGAWGDAVEVPGTAALNADTNTADNGSFVGGVACPSTNSCSMVGAYSDANGVQQAYETDQVNGVWQSATPMPGLLTLGANAPTGYGVAVDQLSCPSAGNCAAGGLYTDSSGNDQAFVENEVNGTWGAAQEVPGSAADNVGGVAVVFSISCYSAGNCAAGGLIAESNSAAQPFVVNETNGAWGQIVPVSSISQANAGGNAGVTAISCVANDQCIAGGFYTANSNGTYESFTTIEAMAPPVPQGVVVTGIAPGQIQVGWVFNQLDGWSPPTYRVTASPGGASCTATLSTGPNCVVKGLNPLVAYTMTVQSVNGAGASAPSAPSLHLYADSTNGDLLVPLTTHIKKGSKFKVLVSGQALGKKAKVSLTGSASASCTPVNLQCVVTLDAKVSGTLTMHLTSSRGHTFSKSWKVQVH